jgi:hypothetical protein
MIQCFDMLFLLVHYLLILCYVQRIFASSPSFNEAKISKCVQSNALYFSSFFFGLQSDPLWVAQILKVSFILYRNAFIKGKFNNGIILLVKLEELCIKTKDVPSFVKENKDRIE